MATFSIYARETLIGHSLLEAGDPFMGVASGVFLPAPDYELVKNECRCNHADQSHLDLSARSETGLEIPCLCVSVLDYSLEMDESFIEVNVMGIAGSLYTELFPQHVESYRQKFK
ncbi:hypothetical protein ACO0LC_08725 [Undibacterium sp. JH2W]|uniref:hypothetical protein n=1 Tax=Undibacterium sp. JH2W TaxID=3413037 RepID=UPI003BF09A9F